MALEKWFDYTISDGIIYKDTSLIGQNAWFENLDKVTNIVGGMQQVDCNDCYGITQIGKGDALFLYPGEFERRCLKAMKETFPRFSTDLVGNSEVVFQNHKRYDDYVGKKLLIIGGGPSTSEVSWENLDYDYIWSCNHFYLNPKLKDRKVDLTFIGQEVKLDDKHFINYIEKYPDIILAFELAGKWMFPHNRTPGIPAAPMENHVCAMTKFYGVLGAGLRQLIFALFLGFKEIYFVGLDGLPGVNTPHAFQKGKVGSGAPHVPGAFERYRLHYTHYWNYVLNQLQPDVKFYNLGEYSEHNMSKEISLQRFPLSDDIKKTIGIK